MKVTRHRCLVLDDKKKEGKSVFWSNVMSSQMTGQGSSPLLAEAIDRLKHRQIRHSKY